MIPTIDYFLEAPRGRCVEAHVRKQFPELYELLKEKHPGSPKYAERIYMYYHNLNEPPICPVCGINRTKYLDLPRGYHAACSMKCSCKSGVRAQKIKAAHNKKSEDEIKAIVEKRKQTSRERYGVDNPSSLESVREKVKQTCIERYGCDSPMKSKEIQQRAQEACMKKYGVTNPGANKEVREKIQRTQMERYGGLGLASKELLSKAQETCQERYGGPNPHCSVEIHKKACKTQIEHFGAIGYASKELMGKVQETSIERYGVAIWSQKDLLSKYPELISFEGPDWTIRCPHPECNKCQEKQFTCERKLYLDRKRFGTEPCTKILPIQASYSEGTTIELFVRNILDKYNIKYETNVRSIVTPQEVDIYIPDKNIAIECNGCYWHSDKIKPINYHHNKFMGCREKGIQLISLWSDWIRMKPQIVESLIKSKLGISGARIFARKCNIKEVQSKVASDFLNKSHIQGRCNSKYNIGLYYNDELVALMCFSRRSKVSGSKQLRDEEWELIRFCNKLDTTVVGAADKLLKHFIKTYNPSYITSFSSNDISDGHLYEVLGFEQIVINKPSYWYINKEETQRLHRSSFTRQSICSRWPEYNINDRTWTERIVMDEKQFIRIYDSGAIKWELKCIK